LFVMAANGLDGGVCNLIRHMHPAAVLLGHTVRLPPSARRC
jgi:hypothetical protein